MFHYVFMTNKNMETQGHHNMYNIYVCINSEAIRDILVMIYFCKEEQLNKGKEFYSDYMTFC